MFGSRKMQKEVVRLKPQPLTKSSPSKKSSVESNKKQYKISNIISLYSTPKVSPLYVPSEAESLTTSVPTYQGELIRIIHAMSCNMTDEFGQERLGPTKANWRTLLEQLPLIDDNGKCIGAHIATLLFPPIFYSDYTTVFHIQNHPDKVIRYHVHGSSAQGPLDPTVLDYWMLKRIESANIAPKVYYYSAPLDPNEYNQKGDLIEDGGYGKTVKTQLPERKLKEFKDIRPSVRYALMDKVDLSIHKYIMSQPERRISFTDAIRICGQMIEILKTIHSMEIVHNDCHMGNFAIHNNRVVIIDFGQAKLMNKRELIDRGSRHEGDFILHPWISPWEMKRYPPSYRDDVYRVLLGMALGIHGDDYAHFLSHICNLRKIHYLCKQSIAQCVIKLKEKGQIFEIPPLDSPYLFPDDIKTSFSLQGIVPDKVLVDVQRLLNEIVTDVISVDVFTKPNYDLIKNKLLEILMLVDDNLTSESLKPNHDPFQMTFNIPPVSDKKDDVSQ